LKDFIASQKFIEFIENEGYILKRHSSSNPGKSRFELIIEWDANPSGETKSKTELLKRIIKENHGKKTT